MHKIKWMTGGFCAIAAAALVGLVTGPSLAGDQAKDAPVKAKISQCVSAPLDVSLVVDRETLLLTDRSGNAVLLKMAGSCLTRNEPIGIEYFGSTRVCSPLDVTITGDITSVVPMRCMVASVTPLSKAEAEAYQTKR